MLGGQIGELESLRVAVVGPGHRIVLFPRLERVPGEASGVLVPCQVECTTVARLLDRAGRGPRAAEADVHPEAHERRARDVLVDQGPAMVVAEPDAAREKRADLQRHLGRWRCLPADPQRDRDRLVPQHAARDARVVGEPEFPRLIGQAEEHLERIADLVAQTSGWALRVQPPTVRDLPFDPDHRQHADDILQARRAGHAERQREAPRELPSGPQEPADRHRLGHHRVRVAGRAEVHAADEGPAVVEQIGERGRQLHLERVAQRFFRTGQQRPELGEPVVRMLDADAEAEQPPR